MTYWYSNIGILTRQTHFHYYADFTKEHKYFVMYNIIRLILFQVLLKCSSGYTSSEPFHEFVNYGRFIFTYKIFYK